MHRGVTMCRDARVGPRYRKNKMKLTSKTFAASAAAMFAVALLVTTAPDARADDYCITNGAQTAHGCGYPTMEACRAASSGIGGTCSEQHSSKSPSESLAFQPRQQHPRNPRKQPAAN